MAETVEPYVVGIPLPDYARREGVTPSAIQKRIERGKLRGRKDEAGNWWITPQDPIDGPGALVLPENATAAYREVVAPLLSEIGNLRQRIGELEAELRLARRDLAATERSLRILARRDSDG